MSLFDFKRQKLQGQHKPTDAARYRPRPTKSIAEFCGFGGSGGSEGGASGDPMGSNISRYSGSSQRMELGNITNSWMPKDPVGLHALWRQIYLHDTHAGVAVDFLSDMPWSTGEIIGIKDPAHIKIFQNTLDNFNPSIFMSSLTKEFLTIGRSSGTLMFDEQQGTFGSYMPHDPDFVTIYPVELYNEDPILDFRPPPGLRQLFTKAKQDKRFGEAIKHFPDKYVKDFEKGGIIELDSVDTLFVARKTFLHDYIGTSLYCVTGNTLIQTEHGLIKIKEIPELLGFEYKELEEVPLSLTVNSHKKPAQTSHWVYTGDKETVKIKTEKGYTVEGTEIHPVLTMNPDDFSVAWKKLKDVQKGDLVAINRTPISYSPLSLDEVEPLFGKTTGLSLTSFYPKEKVRQGSAGAVTKRKPLPLEMTEDLARIIGYLVAEGGVYPANRSVTFSNTNPIILDDYRQLWQKVFPQFTLFEYSRKVESGKICTDIKASSLQLIDFFINMGVKAVKDFKKSLPIAIRLAPPSCLFAFLETFILGDGSVGESQVVIYSTGRTLLRELQVALLSVGIISHRKKIKLGNGHKGTRPMETLQILNSREFVNCCRKIGKFNNFCITGREQPHNTIPWKRLHDSLEPKLRNLLVNPAHIKNFKVGDKIVHSDILYYVAYRRLQGKNNKYSLDGLHRLLPDIDKNIKERKAENYLWEEVTFKKVKKKKVPVYDFCVPETTSFVGNGMVVHNTRVLPFFALEQNLITGTLLASRRRQRSILHLNVGLDDVWEPEAAEIDEIINLFMQADEDPVGAIVGTRKGVEVNEVRDAGSFWKLGDDIDYLGAGKMRALGINESILSGEASYNSMDTALTIVIDRIRALREYLTTQVFYNKIFPTTARIYGMRKADPKELTKRMRLKKSLSPNSDMEEEKKKITSEFISTEKRYQKAMAELQKNPKDASSIKRKLRVLAEEDQKKIRTSDLLVPHIHWHKDLKPSGDENYLNILSTMEEKGLPIPLRTWASAGGIDLDKLCDMLKEDAETRKWLQDWKRTAGGDEGDDAAFASRIVATKKATASCLPIWINESFNGIDKKEAIQYIGSFRGRRYEMLASPEEVTFDINRQFSPKKVEAMQFIMRRIGMVNFPLSREIKDSAIQQVTAKNLDQNAFIKELEVINKLSTKKPKLNTPELKNYIQQQIKLNKQSKANGTDLYRGV